MRGGRWGFSYLRTGATLIQGIPKADSIDSFLARTMPNILYITLKALDVSRCNNRAKKILHNMEIRIVCKNHAKKCLHNSESSRVRQNYTRCKKCAKKDWHNSEIELLAPTHGRTHYVRKKKNFFYKSLSFFSNPCVLYAPTKEITCFWRPRPSRPREPEPAMHVPVTTIPKQFPKGRPLYGRFTSIEEGQSLLYGIPIAIGKLCNSGPIGTS